jgi:hypothetical protein
MQHPPIPRSSRFILILLIGTLLWHGSGNVSFSQALTGSHLTLFSSSTRIEFDDPSAFGLEWQVFASKDFFNIFTNANGSVFFIPHTAPGFSLALDPTGNVGLGTGTPAQKLHLVDGDSPALRFEQNGSSGLTPYTWDIGHNSNIFYVFDAITSQAPLTILPGAPTGSLRILSNGRVGLGTLTPQGNLHIFGAANQDVFNGIGPDLDSGPAFNFGYSGASFGAGSGFFNVRGANSGVNPSLRFATLNVQRMIITNTGRVGIGTTAPTQQLDVSGNIRASGSFIAGGTTLTVPDYVFEPDYQLRPLTELGAYVAQEKHLPDIPSAQEIKKQGVNVSELQMQLLKKIEELTLYAVAQEKTNTAQEKIIATQGATIAALTRAKLAQDRVVKELATRLAALEQRHERK